MQIGVYELVNEEKIKRVLDGEVGRSGKATGGLKTMPKWNNLTEEEKNALIISHYDKLGGLIVKEGLKVVSGTFWDSDLNAPKKEIEEKFVINLDEDIVEVSEDEAKALASAKKKVAELKAKKGEGKKRKRRIKAENIDDVE